MEKHIKYQFKQISAGTWGRSGDKSSFWIFFLRLLRTSVTISRVSSMVLNHGARFGKCFWMSAISKALEREDAASTLNKTK